MFNTKEDLKEILMDLDGVVALLTVMESSDYYKNTTDDGVCRALRNSIELTRNKLSNIVDNINEQNFESKI